MNMSRQLTHTAVVIGAGMGGLAAARALADRFDRVVVLERDTLPAGPLERPGTPQGRHLHALLAGGLRAFETLFPGFEQELAAAGAAPYRAGLDIRIERPGFDPFPRRDLGFMAYSMSRSLLEWLVRQRVRRHDRIDLRDRCRVLEIVASADGAVATGVVYEPANGAATTIDADLIVDASGRGNFTLALLEATGRKLPAETRIEVDVGYATATFAIPMTSRATGKASCTCRRLRKEAAVRSCFPSRATAGLSVPAVAGMKSLQATAPVSSTSFKPFALRPWATRFAKHCRKAT
jgi:2-polyprenyl-6-methoxyphenol hydroxylase-like FAD-dependent oxidoreductase